MSDKNYLYFQRGDEKKLHVIRVDAEDKDIYLQSGWVESDVLMWIKLGLSDEARKALLEKGDITQEQVDEADKLKVDTESSEASPDAPESSEDKEDDSESTDEEKSEPEATEDDSKSETEKAED